LFGSLFFLIMESAIIQLLYSFCGKYATGGIADTQLSIQFDPILNRLTSILTFKSSMGIARFEKKFEYNSLSYLNIIYSAKGNITETTGSSFEYRIQEKRLILQYMGWQEEVEMFGDILISESEFLPTSLKSCHRFYRLPSLVTSHEI
jgi:hypothetical protein